MDGSSKRTRVDVNPSDEEDERLFQFLDPNRITWMLRLKRDDPGVTHFGLYREESNEATLRRLGDILAQNTRLEHLTLSDCVVDVTGLCAGLQNNKSIQHLNFWRVDLSDTDKMARLAPFLTGNPSLREIELNLCGIEPAGFNILLSALADRTVGNLHRISLGGNPLGDIKLEQLVEMLRRNREFHSLNFNLSGIGPTACTSLTSLLEDQDSVLSHLCLIGNSIDESCACALAASLSENTTLKNLDLTINSITVSGLRAFLNLVCNRTNFEDVRASNHTLESLSAFEFQRTSLGALGSRDASLLHASLKLNKSSNKVFVAQRKVLWGHARADYNIGDSPLDIGEISHILSCFGDPEDETISSLVESSEPPFPEREVAAMRLDSMYRIIRLTPNLWCQVKPHSLSD